MKKLLIFVITVFFIALAGIAIAANPIKLFIDDNELKLDISPQLINDRTIAPVRSVAEALGAGVEWDAKDQMVKITSQVTRGKVWDDSVEAWDSKTREAVGVVSRYLASLMSPFGEKLESLATEKALDVNSPNKIIQPFMLTGETVIPGFEILDVRKMEDSIEIAVRRYEMEFGSPSCQPRYVDEEYTVIWENRIGDDGYERSTPLIDGVMRISSSTVDKIW